MPQPTAQIARHTLTYGFGFVVGGLARLALIPVIARTLSPEEYGVYALLLAAIALLHIVFDLGFVDVLIRFHHENAEPTEQRRLRSILFVLLPIFDITIAMPLLLGRHWLSAFLFGTPDHGDLVFLAVAIALFATQFQLFVGHLRSEDRSGDFVIVMALRGLIVLATTLFLVLVLDMGVTGFLLGQLVAPTVITLVAIPRLLGRVGLDLSQLRARLTPLLRYGAPLVPTALGMWALSYLDAYLLRAFASLEAVGVYRFAAEVCLPLSLLLTSFQLAWPSFAFAQARSPEGAEQLATVFRHMFALLVWASLALAALRHEIFEVIGAETYLASVQIIPLWVLATCLYGASLVFSTGLRVAQKTHKLPLYVLAAIALNAVLAVLVIPSTGVLGCAAVKVVTLLILAALILRESNRHFAIPFELGKIAAMVAAGAVVLAITDSYGEMSLLAGIVLRGGTVLLFPGLLMLMQVISLHELRSPKLV
ncbi:MAG: oligosaccharide flippase family protein [Pseudomonadota bacterium]